MIKKFNMKFNSENQLIIERAKGTSVLNIFYQDNIKEIILPVTKKISKEYQIYSNRSEQRSISKGIFYLNQQIMDHESKLVDAQAKAELFSVNNEISLVPTEENRKILITDIELLNSKAQIKSNIFLLN